MTNQICSDDVKNVASSIKMNLTDEQINEVLSMYDFELSQDPTVSWDLVVEYCIYQVID
jgi:uncharacterized protein YpuA (DUF1002 family)